MLKSYTAFTKEIDNPQAAAREILEQLKPEENMLSNTVGIVHFFHEFVDTGVCRAIAAALPFEIAGCVSSYIGTGGDYAEVAMSVTMLTGDGVRFAVRALEGISAKSKEEITENIVSLCTELSTTETPKMIIPFVVPLPHFTGDDFVAAVNALPLPIPFFGTIALNMDNITDTNYVLVNSGVSSDMHGFIALYGDIKPRFRYTASFAFDDSFSNCVEITDAAGSVLKSINGVTTLEFLKKHGIVTADNSLESSALWALPTILTCPNGTKTARSLTGVVEGTEFVLSTGSMEIGTKIRFAHLDGDKVLESAENLIGELTESKENDVLAYSCAARAWALGTRFFAEAQRIAERAEWYKQKNGVPLNYCAAYSGGEICPVYDKGGNLVNALHNYTFITCAFNQEI